jgi:hypothetical protein
VPFLQIPREQQPGLVKLALLSDRAASELHGALSAAAQNVEGGSVSAESVGPLPGLSQ